MPSTTKKIISSSGWLGSGAANAGNTGFDSLSTAQFLTDERNEKCITTAASNTALSARIDAAANVLANGETIYMCEFCAFAEFGGRSNSNTIGTVNSTPLIDVAGVGPRAYVGLSAINSESGIGFALTFSAANGASVGAVLSGLGSVPIPVNEKVRIGIVLDKTAGLVGLLINGQLAGTWTATPPAAWDTTITLALPASDGVQWRLYSPADRPCQSWTGSDNPFAAMEDTLKASNDGLRVSMPHLGIASAYSPWSYSGTGSVTEFASTGVNPNRKRMVGGAGGYTGTSRKIGYLPFNTWGECAVWTSLYVPNAASGSIAIRNAADSVDLFKLQVLSGQLCDWRGVPLQASDGASVAIASTKRYFLILNPMVSGAVAWTVLDGGSALNARAAWCGVLEKNYQLGPAGGAVLFASQNVEWDRVDIGPWCTLPLGDLNAADAVDALTPTLYTPANIGAGFPGSDAACAIPGIGYPARWYGQPRESWLVTVARPGFTRAAWATYVRPYLTATKALRIVAVDGAVRADLAAGTTADALMAHVAADLEFAIKNNAELVLMPYMLRPSGLGESLTVAQQAEARRFNRLQAAFVRDNALFRGQPSPWLKYADSTTGLQPNVLSTTGNVPTAANVPSISRAIASTVQNAATWAKSVPQTVYKGLSPNVPTT